MLDSFAPEIVPEPPGPLEHDPRTNTRAAAMKSLLKVPYSTRNRPWLFVHATTESQTSLLTTGIKADQN